MVRRLDAVYQNGVICPLEAVQGLDESARVRLTVESGEASGKGLAEIAGILPTADATEMMNIIDGEFEKVDPGEW